MKEKQGSVKSHRLNSALIHTLSLFVSQATVYWVHSVLGNRVSGMLKPQRQQ